MKEKQNKDALSIILDKLEVKLDIIEKNSSDVKLDLVNEIMDLESLYKDMVSYVNDIKRNKLGLKTTADMYANVINIKKLILDTKEKKAKIIDNDIKIIKAISDSIQKVRGSMNITESDDNIDASSIINSLYKKAE